MGPLVAVNYKKRVYPVQRAPALCGVWGRVLVAVNYKINGNHIIC